VNEVLLKLSDMALALAGAGYIRGCSGTSSPVLELSRFCHWQQWRRDTLRQQFTPSPRSDAHATSQWPTRLAPSFLRRTVPADPWARHCWMRRYAGSTV